MLSEGLFHVHHTGSLELGAQLWYNKTRCETFTLFNRQMVSHQVIKSYTKYTFAFNLDRKGFALSENQS